MRNYRKYRLYILLFLIVTSAIFAWYILSLSHKNSNILTVAFLDVGQGDAVYIEAPNGKQMLIDGGPDNKVLSELAKVMPFADRSLDVVLATHDDKDHIGGLPAVLDHYKVGHVFENGATSDTDVYQALESRINKKHIDKVIARRGMKVVLDEKKNIYLNILFPDRDTTNMESNEGSIVCKLVYDSESFMFTGDSPKYSELEIIHNETKDTLHANVLKLGHHGSKTSSSELWLEVVKPDVAIISAGLHNNYGHPSKEVLDMLNNLHIPYLATYDKGTIILKTDGVHLNY